MDSRSNPWVAEPDAEPLPPLPPLIRWLAVVVLGFFLGAVLIVGLQSVLGVDEGKDPRTRPPAGWRYIGR